MTRAASPALLPQQPYLHDGVELVEYVDQQNRVRLGTS